MQNNRMTVILFLESMMLFLVTGRIQFMVKIRRTLLPFKKDQDDDSRVTNTQSDERNN